MGRFWADCAWAHPPAVLASQAALGRTPSGLAGTSRGTGSEATAPPRSQCCVPQAAPT